jgi:hypothetical protein
MELVDAFKMASYKAWDEMEPVSGFSRITQVREDGLTPLILKELARSGCSAIVDIIESPKHGKQSEKFLGYDFEIWIGTKTRKIRYIIQAKSQRNQYHLDSKYEIDTEQLVRLERYALVQRDYKAIPLYCYYKHLQEDDKTLNNYYNSHTVYDKKALGITVSSSLKVKSYNEISFHELHRFQYDIKNWFPNILKYPSFFHYNEAMAATVPFHELALFTISQIDAMNKRYHEIREKLRSLGVFPFFFFYPYSLFSNDGEKENLIPVHNITREEIISYAFGIGGKEVEVLSNRKEPLVPTKNFEGRALIIIETKE